MLLDEIKKIAKQHGIKTSKMKKSDIVRAIQCAEGNESCFDTDRALSCGQDGCLWRDDCK